jgi:hypothetical protein
VSPDEPANPGEGAIMDATTPPRGDDEPTGAQPAVPPPLAEPARGPRAGGSTAVGAAAASGPDPAQPSAAPARDDAAEDPTVPDTAVEATLTREPAGSSPNEPVVPTSSPDKVQVAAPEAAAPETSALSEQPAHQLAASAAPSGAATAAQAAPPSEPAQAAPPSEPAEAAPSSPPAAPAHDVVFVAAPTPPKKKGNRGIGVLLAALSTILFLVIYVAVVVLINTLQGRGGSLEFLANIRFYLPVLLFAIGFILLAVLANRAGWWSFVLGSFFVGAFVYFGTVGLLLLSEATNLTPQTAVTAFRGLLISPIVIAAGLVAREVSLWVGAAISARGRRVKARNAEARAEFDREQAEHRAEMERTGAVVRPA